MSKPISERKAATGAGCARGFFLIFLVFGLGFGYGFFLRPMWKIMAAGNWPEVPCTIVSSQVKASSDGDTFRPEIRFRYRFGDREFEGGSYSFVSASTSGREGKRQIVARFRVGSPATCFVNSRNPSEAVLERGFVPELWWGLLPALFCLIGIGGFFFAGKLTSSQVVENVRGVPTDAIAAAGENVVLKPKSSRWAKLLGIALFAVFWIGITFAVFGRAESKAPIIFPIVFGGGGVLLLFSVIYQFLACLNPLPIVTVNRQVLPLGSELKLQWFFSGRARRIGRLRIFLRGTEEATYRRGTNTTTDRHVFTELDLANTTDPDEIATGTAQVMLPAETMHTFIAPNNKILWSLHLHGDIAKWPDVDETFEITVLPLPGSA